MDKRIITFFAFIATVSCKDIIVTGGDSTKEHLVYNETIETNAAIWRQIQNVTVNTTENEVVSRIEIIDLRPEKDGEAAIVEGGKGKNTVTIELKSPTVFRGFHFSIAVYATPTDVPFDPTATKDKSLGKPSTNDDKLNFNAGEGSTAPNANNKDKDAPLPPPLNINDGKRTARDTVESKKADENLPKDIKFPEHPIEVKENLKPSFDKNFDGKTALFNDGKVKGLEPELEKQTQNGAGIIDRAQESFTSFPSFAKDLKTNENPKRHVRDVSKQDNQKTSIPAIVPKIDAQPDIKHTEVPSLSKSSEDNTSDESAESAEAKTDGLIQPKTGLNTGGQTTTKSAGLKGVSTTTTTIKPRITRDTEQPIEVKDNKKSEFNDKTDGKSVLFKDGTFTQGAEPSDFGNGGKIIPGNINKAQENSTNLHTFNVKVNKNEDLKRHVRDVSEQDKQNTSIPALVSKIGDHLELKHTEEPSLPKTLADNINQFADSETKGDGFIQTKTKKNEHSTTTEVGFKGVSITTPTTAKPRAARDTESEKLIPNQDHIQKIPADGRVHTDAKTLQGLDDFAHPVPANTTNQDDKTVTTPKNSAQTSTPHVPIAISLQPKGSVTTTTAKTDLKTAGIATDSKSEESAEDEAVVSGKTLPFAGHTHQS